EEEVWGRVSGVEVAARAPAALVVNGQHPGGRRRCPGRRGGGTAPAGSGEQPGSGENRDRGQASHSGSPSLSVTAGRVTSAPWRPRSRAASTASPTAPISGASDGNRAATSSGGDGTPAVRAACSPRRTRGPDRARPPPTAHPPP